MNTARTASRVWLSMLLACVAFACGDRLILDPSFELWCGETLCKPWESQGEITRVGTWHRHDYGVQLEDGAEISQHVDHAPVKCIEFELIADVSAEAEVELELDFMDDGHVDHREPIAESHWARLHYLVRAPTWYDGLRFTVRKYGKGRAVLAQLAAESSSDCEGKPIPLNQRPDGGRCDNERQCASLHCGPIPQRVVFDGQPPTNLANVCDGCEQDQDCAANQVCGVAESKWGPYHTCIESASSALGAFCEHHAECASGRCVHGLPFNNATCADCTQDADCADGELCGLDVLDGGATRVCEPQAALALGALCGENAQCDSGVCCFGACSECCGDWLPCEDGSECGSSQAGGASATQLCRPGARDRAPGRACGSDLDCASRHCEQSENECLLPGNEDSPDFFEAVCRVAEQLAGSCR